VGETVPWPAAEDQNDNPPLQVVSCVEGTTKDGPWYTLRLQGAPDMPFGEIKKNSLPISAKASKFVKFYQVSYLYQAWTKDVPSILLRTGVTYKVTPKARSSFVIVTPALAEDRGGVRHPVLFCQTAAEGRRAANPWDAKLDVATSSFTMTYPFSAMILTPVPDPAVIDAWPALAQFDDLNRPAFGSEVQSSSDEDPPPKTQSEPNRSSKTRKKKTTKKEGKRPRKNKWNQGQLMLKTHLEPALQGLINCYPYTLACFVLIKSLTVRRNRLLLHVSLYFAVLFEKFKGLQALRRSDDRYKRLFYTPLIEAIDPYEIAATDSFCKKVLKLAKKFKKRGLSCDTFFNAFAEKQLKVSAGHVRVTCVCMCVCVCVCVGGGGGGGLSIKIFTQ
jgi:hypothetical protein